MSQCRSLVLVSIYVALATAMLSSTSDTQPIGVQVVHLSDFHWDPFFGTPSAVGPCANANVSVFGEPGCDSSYTMVKSALFDAYNRTTTTPVQQPRLFLFTGDFMRHQMANVSESHLVGLNITNTLAEQIVAQFGAQTVGGGGLPHWIIHPALPAVLGNDDFIPDYHFNVSNAGQDKLLQGIAQGFKATNLMSHDEAEQFSYCGFNKREVNFNETTAAATAPLTILCLNSLVWAREISPKPTDEDPCGQFAWLEKELEIAKNAQRRVYIQSHIPPGVLWETNYNAQYLRIVQNYTQVGVIAAQFYGHLHRWSFAAMSADNSVAPLFIGGPITRASKTTPDYSLIEVCSNWTVLDILQRPFLEPLGWVDGSKLKEYFGLPDLSTSTLYKFATEMMDYHNTGDKSLFEKFWIVFNGGDPSRRGHCAGSLCEKVIACQLKAMSFLECDLLGAKLFKDV